MESDSAYGMVTEIVSTNDPKKLLPIDLDLSNDGLSDWLARRVIPKNRAFVAEVLHTLGLLPGDTKGIIDVCLGLSLNDSYWIVPEGFDKSFDDLNLYENHFSEALSLVAYTGVDASDKEFSTSPELTTHGFLPKAWRFVDGEGIYLYKRGTTGFANVGREPYSEHYASQIAEAMGLYAVKYDLENWKGITASKCKLFTDKDTAYIPIGRIVTTGGLRAVGEFYHAYGMYDSLCDMLVFDALIYNQDRHFGNFGILRDNKTGAILGSAPLFDHGISLFAQAMPNDYSNLDRYAETLTPPYAGTTFEGIYSEFATQRQTAMLRKVLSFTFRRHPFLNLPEEHLKAIEQKIQRRASQLLSLERFKTKQAVKSGAEKLSFAQRLARKMMFPPFGKLTAVTFSIIMKRMPFKPEKEATHGSKRHISSRDRQAPSIFPLFK
jgi:hypothetical protein